MKCSLCVSTFLSFTYGAKWMKMKKQKYQMGNFYVSKKTLYRVIRNPLATWLNIVDYNNIIHSGQISMQESKQFPWNAEANGNESSFGILFYLSLALLVIICRSSKILNKSCIVLVMLLLFASHRLIFFPTQDEQKMPAHKFEPNPRHTKKEKNCIP